MQTEPSPETTIIEIPVQKIIEKCESPEEPVEAVPETPTKECTEEITKKDSNDAEPIQSKQPKKRNQQNGKTYERRDRQPRKQREKKYAFREDPNWRDAVKSETTLETKQPVSKARNEMMQRPTRDGLNKKLTKKNGLVGKKRNEIKKLYEEKNKLREITRKKNNEGYNMFVTLKETKEKAFDALKKMKDSLKYEKMRTRKTKRQNRLRELMDKSPFKGVAKTMVQAKNHIAKLEQEFRDKNKTFNEEKIMVEALTKYKKGLGHFEKIDIVQKDLNQLRENFNKARDQVMPLERVYKAARGALAANSEEYKKKLEEKEKAEGKADKQEKKENIMSPEEKAVMKKVEAIKEDIKNINLEKDELFDEFDKEMMEYFKEQFEVKKNKYVEYLLNGLKKDERSRKWAEEEGKRAQEKAEKVKESRKEIFSKEIQKCATVNGALQLLKLDNDRSDMLKNHAKALKGVNMIDTSGIKTAELETENLQLMVSKKEDYSQGPVSKRNKKKRKNKKAKTNLVMVSKVSNKSLLPLDIIVALSELGVEAPTELTQADETISAVAEKRDQFLVLRQKYVDEEELVGEEADIVAVAEKVMIKDRRWGGDEEGDREESGNRNRKDHQKKGNKAKKKVVKEFQENEGDFPTL